MKQKILPDSHDVNEKSYQNVNAGAHKILAVQFVLVFLLAVIFLYFQGAFTAQSAIYGGLVAMLNVWTSDRVLQMAMRLASASPGSEVGLLYMGAVQRFVTTLVLFAVGMLWLQLSALALLSAFAIAQVGYWFKESV